MAWEEHCQVNGLGRTLPTNLPSGVLIGNVGLDKKLIGTEGKNLIIRCSAVGGVPAPDVKLLISESVVKVAKSSVQHTLPSVNRSYDGQNITCLAGYEEIPYYPFNESAGIFLILKPYPPRFSSDSATTEETKPLVISCTSTGSRPKASIYWLLGDGKINITTNATQSSPTHDPTTDTYSVTSTLTYIVDRIYNGKYLICGASNEVTLGQGGVVETSITLNITYPPNITVTSPTYTQNDADRTVTCIPSGNPESYTYHKWQHRTRYGDIIREFGGNKTLKLPDVKVLLRYQDSGEYVCIASNGIKNKFNKLEQTGFGLVSVEAQPVFTSDNIDRITQFGEIDKAVDIYVNVYSVPKFTSFVWTREGTPITTKNSASTIVRDVIHGKKVQLDGYNVTLTLPDLKAKDFANYTLTLESGFPDVKFTIVLESASVPETPGNFSTVASSATSITVQWDPRSGGGYKQTFHIQYRVQGSSEWTTVSAGEEDVNEQRRRRTYEVRNLQEGKAYEMRMYAENKAMKRSNFTDVLISYTQSSVSTTSSAVIGAVVGVVVTIVIVCASFIVILFIKWSRGKDKREKNDKFYVNTGFQNIQNGDEYEEVENKFDIEHPQSSKTYETLGTKDKISVYDDLENTKGVTSSKSSMGVYETLGVQDKPGIYAEMENQKEQKQLNKQHEGKKHYKKPNDHNDSMELNTTQERTEKVYENEVF